MSVTVVINVPNHVYRALLATAARNGVQVHTLIEKGLERSVKPAPSVREPRDTADHRIIELNRQRMSDNAIAKVIGMGQPAVSKRRRDMGLQSPTPRRRAS